MTAIPVEINDTYQITLPEEIRSLLRIRPQDTLLFLIDGDAVFIRPKPKRFTEKLRGLHHHVWSSDPDEWLAEERDSWG